jgi:hypothetical protein
MPSDKELKINNRADLGVDNEDLENLLSYVEVMAGILEDLLRENKK